jgi:hypothetical protein
MITNTHKMKKRSTILLTKKSRKYADKKTSRDYLRDEEEK